MDLRKKLLYKILVKYYLNYNIKIPFENFALALENAWASPDFNLLATSSKNKKQTLGPALTLT